MGHPFRIPGGAYRQNQRSQSAAIGRGRMNPTDEFRGNSAKCRSLANAASDPAQKAEWLKLSEEWLRIAAAAHIRPDTFDAK
jgi:hypothetical protein